MRLNYFSVVYIVFSLYLYAKAIHKHISNVDEQHKDDKLLAQLNV